MENKPQNEEGKKPTPQVEMSPQESSEPTATNLEKEVSDPLEVFKAAGIADVTTKEEAIQKLKNLNSFVGDQTIAKLRKIGDTLTKKTGYQLEELADIVEGINLDNNQPIVNQPDEARAALATARSLQVELFVRDIPEARAIKDSLLEDVRASGKSPEEIWGIKYAPLVKLGRESGAKKLQSNIESQPTKAVSTTEKTDTKLDFSGNNPSTGKPWTAAEMEKYLPHARV